MGLAPNHHLPLAAVHAHTIARHNPGSDADLALAAYCPPGGRRLRPAPLVDHLSLLVELLCAVLEKDIGKEDHEPDEAGCGHCD
jgi:hypothetical protein